jgi:phosphoribosylformylglycinamidine cyclo-ligase
VTREAYRRSGVDVAAGEEAVARIRERVEATFGPEVLTGLGGFAAAVAVPAGVHDPVLVSATDGVGTKTAIAARVGRYDTIGIDLVAMCADDVACLGATPLFFLDYVAVEHLDPDAVAALVSGIAAGCREAGCALVGGETAEHPGLLAGEASSLGFDLAGFCVGVVEREDLIDRPTGRPGDVLIGLEASGLHANGYSLVRSLVAERDLDLGAPYLEFVRRTLGEQELERVSADEPDHVMASLGDVLLTPTRVYAPHLLALREGLRARGLAVRGYAHVTGGGLPGNVPRALPEGAAARLDPSRWPVPAVIRYMAALGGLDPAEMRAIFNGGIGMVAVVEPGATQPAIDLLAERGVRAWQVGEVVEARGPVRYEEAPLSGRAL